MAHDADCVRAGRDAVLPDSDGRGLLAAVRCDFLVRESPFIIVNTADFVQKVELSGVHAADLGVNVGRVEDRVPPVQYLSTPAACYRYGCYVLPTGAD